MTKGKRIVSGDRVMFAAEHLRNTAQYTGDPAPTNWGPFARGQVTRVDPMNHKLDLIEVRWDNGQLTRVLSSNLEREM